MPDLFPTLLGIIAMLLVLALMGGLVSLIALLPPIRRSGRRSKLARIAVVSAIAVITFAISFGLFTRLGAEVTYIFGTIGAPPWAEAEDPLRPAIVHELWLRSALPPFSQRACYTTDARVCERADQAEPEGLRDWEAYWTGLALCSVSSMAGGALAYLFTRRKGPDTQA